MSASYADDGEAESAIRTRGLSKRFGARLAVERLDLEVPRGSVFGFLGPNGSGKTTTIRMLLGLATPSGGTMSVLGRPMPQAAMEVLPRIGTLVEGPAFYPYLTGTANLLRLDAANRATDPATRKRRIGRALERVGLGQAAGLAVHAYSLGMKQRLGLANALASERELLILDEPTNGLDPQGTREVRHLIGSLAEGGATVFVSSHLLSEIEQVCTHAAVVGRGRLLAQGTLASLFDDGPRRILVRTRDVPLAGDVLRGLGLMPVEEGVPAPGAGTLRAPLGEDAPEPERIVAALVAAGVGVRGVEVEHASLEDRFVELTGEGFDVEQ
ncbi:ABC transporter ATP-binding protein [Citricoccus zhacaiensis]|uniref:ABC transporter ATP-binding protein n=1 Tax=Citricoccus zhacaiensis TaxID=489142 RepID=A0ABQ2LY88_9MICC|nr:ATP-binding cassette domain-containing protein [Citricoccus zhacaiensis]GGO44689.1 ABC transporter ATP-binding protein [Citricoccus zhacaiensis]